MKDHFFAFNIGKDVPESCQLPDMKIWPDCWWDDFDENLTAEIRLGGIMCIAYLKFIHSLNGISATSVISGDGAPLDEIMFDMIDRGEYVRGGFCAFLQSYVMLTMHYPAAANHALQRIGALSNEALQDACMEAIRGQQPALLGVLDGLDSAP
jgi:hypothetical protein